MDNRRLLVFIAVLVVAAVCIVIVENLGTRSTGEKISDNINEAAEEIKDEIDDHTTDPKP